MSTIPPAVHSPWRRTVAISVALAAVVAIVVLAFSWPGLVSEVKNLPIAVAGPSALVDQVESGLEKNAPGTFVVTPTADRDSAVALIKQRSVYGAIVLSAAPEVLTASAASPIVSQALTGLAGQLENQVNAAAAATAPPGGAIPHITVKVTDVVPLSPNDPRGVGLVAAAFPLVLGGMVGGIGLTVALVGAWRRLVGVVLYAVIAGAAIAAILQGWFGVLEGSFALNWAGFSMSLLAIGAPIVGFAALVGRAGVAIGPVLFLLIANPISSAAQPKEFLPEPWGAIGQWFPPGAGATLIRNLSYFPHANSTFPWFVLSLWALVGILLGVLGHYRTAGGATREAIAEAEHDGELEAAPAA